MKKFLAIIVLLAFSFTSFSQSFAAYYYSEDDVTYWTSEVVYYQSELNKTTKGQDFLKILDSILENYKNDEKFLLELENKLYYTYTYDMSELSANVIEYLYAKVSLFLANIELARLNEILNPSISDTDKKTAETKILAIQSNLYTILESSFSQLTNPKNLRQTGNMKINFEANIPGAREAKGKFELSDYVATSNGFDAKFNGNLNTLIETINTDEENVKFQFTSFLDLIMKEGTMYLNMKDFNILDKQNLGDNFEEILVKVKEFLAANGDKYIRYEDYTTQEIINMFASPQTKSFLTDLKTAMASPLFEAYKVEDGKYYLRPTTSACSMFISLDCSDEDYYKGFLTWFMDFGEIYLSIDGSKTTIGFSNEYSDGKITFSGNNVDLLINFYSYWEELIATFTGSGNFTKNTIDFKSKLEFSDEMSNSYFFFYDDESHKITGNLNFNVDTSNNRNNVYMLLDILDNDNIIVKYEIKNVGSSYEDNSAKIEAPTNVINFEDLLFGY